MNEVYAKFIEFANAAWKRRWTALAVAWIVCAFGWTVVISKPNTYTASTKIFLDTATLLKPLLQGLAIEPDVNTELEVMKQTLTTRSNLEKVARITDLDITAATPVEMELLLDGLRNRTTVQTDGRFLLSISYRDIDPVRARDVVQALTQVFIDTNLGATREEIADAEVFLDRQIAQYEKAMEAAEQQLAKFKEERVSKLPDEPNYRFRIETLRGDLEDAQASLKHAQMRRMQLREQLTSVPISKREAAILEAERALEDLRTKYTDKHPEVIAAQRRLAALTADVPEHAAGPEQSATTDPGRAKLSADLVEAEADVATYSDRVQRLRRRVDDMEELAAQVPEAEADLARLNRDYDVLKIKLSELLTRREQARISRDREAGSQPIRYEIVDPPRVPAIADSPSRSVLITAVLAIALAAGVGVTFAVSQLKDSFADPVQLRKAFNLSVLGTVSFVDSTRRHTWTVADFSSFTTCIVLLLASYGAVMAAEARTGWAKVIPPGTIETLYHRLVSIPQLFQ